MRIFGVRRAHFADTIAATVVSAFVAFLAVPVAVAAAAVVVAVADDSGIDEDAVEAATIFGSAAVDPGGRGDHNVFSFSCSRQRQQPRQNRPW